MFYQFSFAGLQAGENLLNATVSSSRNSDNEPEYAGMKITENFFS